MTYCGEYLVTASMKIIDSLENLHNQIIRLLTGTVKSTPIDFPLLYTNSKPFSLRIQKRAVLLWEKIIRTPGLNMWDHISSNLCLNVI